MTFIENFLRICNDRGTTPSTLLKELGLSTSKATAWKNGSLPKESVMVDLARLLNCSVMDFFADENDIVKKSLPVLNARQDDNDDIDDIIRIYNSLRRRDRIELMHIIYEFESRI